MSIEAIGAISSFSPVLVIDRSRRLGEAVVRTALPEELSATANELNRWEFLFMASPHGVPNGAGTAINPLAVF